MNETRPTKRILIRSGKSPFDAVPAEGVIHRDLIGTNSGNLVFSDAAHKLLTLPDTEVVSNGLKADPRAAARINEEYDVFVIPLANAFRISFAGSLDRLARLIEQLKIPVVVLGVGAQSTLGYDPERLRRIEEPVKRFMKAVLDHSPSVGVRGEFTQSYLNGLGFRDVEVIGCPSMFLHGPEIRVEKRVDALTRDSRISVNASHSALRTSGEVGRFVTAAWERYPDLVYIAQNLIDAELMFWGDVSEAAGNHSTMPIHRTHPLYRENKVRLYSDSATWIKELSERDFSFGTRIHGNIAALLAGTPCTVLCHDSRTLELCRYFDIPHRMLTEVPPDVDPADLYEQADFGPLVKGHPERFERFASFLDRHGLRNTFTHGDGGAAFDARLRELDLPPAIDVWDGTDDGRLGYRFSRLRQRDDEAAKKIAELTKRVTTLEKRLAALERGRSGNAVVRVGRAVRRRVVRR
ncbi:polysaccharide pyruvyl transferase family protein [Streptomyces sp. TRM 70361]|uniref:polysaccharide pyruvyl transferase family protein n=1 Tax=Streptomyces sp. TRM 70361 TaxID=3116553 RepID=UPI002E7C0183|nr:polysaccharide pyruvyl transferase family protein [Streptomyces sp. TRM 70361]MEE1941097.1 polysaccharide pyruvyl transferase family protein [Streptomyces sp. TRM 70361]